MNLKEQIEALREKGLTVREITETLNISNHDYYENVKETTEEHSRETKGKVENSESFSTNFKPL